MEILLALLVALVVGTLCIVCFYIGAKVGQTVAMGEKIETPIETVKNAVREHQERKEAEAKQNELEAIMRNIESYDGTGYGQEDVPRG
jgi:flagellar basal body-associated protein FliL